MTTPEITEEMRRAVYAADCERHGHVMDVSAAISNDPDIYPDENTVRVRGPEPDTIPHLSCRRCRKVWLVVEDTGDDYDEAVTKLRGRMKDPETVRPRKRREDQRDTRPDPPVQPPRLS